MYPEQGVKYWRTAGDWFKEWWPLIVFVGFIVTMGVVVYLLFTGPRQELWTLDEVKVWTAQLENGREVTCIRLGGKHGISCDWANVRIVSEIGTALVVNP